MDMIPSGTDLEALAGNVQLTPLPDSRVEKEKLIFRTYDSANINRAIP